MIHCLVDLQLDGTFGSQDKESDEVDGQIIDSEVAHLDFFVLFITGIALEKFSIEC